MQKIVIGVMGPGEQATDQDQALAYELGQRIAEAGWVLLTGGRSVGVMDAASRGAKAANGLTIGILPSAEPLDANAAIDIGIATDMGNARNIINVLSSRVVIVCGMGSGTASEVALALKVGKPVILLNPSHASRAFWQSLSTSVLTAPSVAAAIQQVNRILVDQNGLTQL